MAKIVQKAPAPVAKKPVVVATPTPAPVKKVVVAPPAAKKPVPVEEVPEEVAEEVEAETPDSGEVDVTEQLDALDTQEWEDTEEKEGFTEVPDDTYPCEIVEAIINNAKSSGRLQVSWTFKIVGDSDYRGRQIWSHQGLDSPEARGWFRGALAKLGVEWPKSAKELPDLLESLIGSFCEVKVKVSKKDPSNSNKYIVKALDSSEIPDAPEELPAEEEAAEADADPEAETGEGEEAVEEAADPSTEEGPISLNFEDATLKVRHKNVIAQLAETWGFNADDYDTQSALLADIAEHVGVTGEFDNPQALIEAVSAVQPEGAEAEAEAEVEPEPEPEPVAPVKKPVIKRK